MSTFIKCDVLYGCYQIKKNIPNKLINVNKRTDKKYKNWRKNTTDKFSMSVKRRLDNLWWKSLSKNKKEELYNRYKKNIKKNDFENFIKTRRWRFIGNILGCIKYKTIKKISDITYEI
jgi:hypothetical protein